MKQQTFSDIEYSNRKRKTKREEFLTLLHFRHLLEDNNLGEKIFNDVNIVK